MLNRAFIMIVRIMMRLHAEGLLGDHVDKTIFAVSIQSATYFVVVFFLSSSKD